jgi:hypothetical protein
MMVGVGVVPRCDRGLCVTADDGGGRTRSRRGERGSSFALGGDGGPTRLVWVLAGPVDAEARRQFRAELRDRQTNLRNYTRLIADLADVEDLTDLEAV